MASLRTKTVSRRKPVKRRTSSSKKSASRTKPAVKRVSKKQTVKKTTTKTLYAVDAKGQKTNLKIIVK